jgi:hypothetical protein
MDGDSVNARTRSPSIVDYVLLTPRTRAIRPWGRPFWLPRNDEAVEIARPCIGVCGLDHHPRHASHGGMRRWPAIFLLATLCLFLVHGTGSAASAARAAVFDFEWIDTSLEGGMNGLRQDEQERLHMLGERLRRELAESGRFEIVDIAPVADEARHSNLQACGGCEASMARALGAKLAITATVQKVSNLILNINIYTHDADTGRLLFAASADMRGNTDESWFRTLDWIVRNRLLADQGR